MFTLDLPPIGAGLDVRGDGGHIIAPPSIHPSGQPYTWRATGADSLAVAPDWLMQLTRHKPRPTISERAVATIRRPTNSTSPGAYGRAALDAEAAALAAALPGTRNTALNRAAFNLFQLVAGGELDGGQVEQRASAMVLSRFDDQPYGRRDEALDAQFQVRVMAIGRYINVAIFRRGTVSPIELDPVAVSPQ